MTRPAARFISAHHITAPQEFTMGSETKKAGPRDPRRIAFVMMVAAIVIAVGAVGYVMYSNSTASKSVAPRAIIAGDSVTLDYIGRLPDGRVFDTSLWYVSQDDALYPKSLTFTLRANSSYTPFTMTAGNYGAGGTIKGFALGVLGLYEGDHELIEVPPDEGYPIVPQLLTTFNITDTIPITTVMTEDQFSSYFSKSPVAMDVLTHPFWQWSVLVAQVANGLVTLKSQPYVGESVYPYGNPNLATSPSGWAIKVIGYDPAADGGVGRITIKNVVTASDVYNVRGIDSQGDSLIIWSYDDTNQTFQVNKSDTTHGYNAEVSGRTLFFEITINKVVAGVS